MLAVLVSRLSANIAPVGYQIDDKASSRIEDVYFLWLVWNLPASETTVHAQLATSHVAGVVTQQESSGLALLHRLAEATHGHARTP